MKIQFKNSLGDYDYLLMFDLASRKTGVCLWDISTATPVWTTIIEVRGEKETPSEELYVLLDRLMDQLRDKGISPSTDVLIGKEAMPTQIRGASSTVQTFLALARSHAILDLYAAQNDIDVYDYVGVYPISTHAYLKKLVEIPEGRKVQKQDIKDYVVTTYGVADDLSFDEYDAIFLAQTLVRVKWNKDINEEIRALRRRRKELKSASRVSVYLEEEKRLLGLLVTAGEA